MSHRSAIHLAFRLDGRRFTSPAGLLDYVERHHPTHYPFLSQWFDHNPEVEVQTSGTTGSPKTYRIPKAVMEKVARRSIDFFGLKPGSKALLNLSSGFIAGKMMWVRALTGGWELDVVPVRRQLVFPPDKHYDFGAMVPYQAYANAGDLVRFDRLLLGGAPVDEAFVRRLARWPVAVYLTYGMTETLTHVAVRPLNTEAGRRMGRDDLSRFYTLPGIGISYHHGQRLRITDPLLPYSPVDTEDLVEILDERSFHWLGRAGNVINSGGYKIIPEEVERKLAPYIRRPFYVAGVPHPQWGSAAVLFIEGTPYEEDWRALFERAGLHRFAYPKDIRFFPTFERTSSGKIIRKTH